MLRLVVTAALPLWVALAPIADAAEPSNRIWDPDLKRYLTEEEIGKVEVYLTEEQALKLLFPKSQNIRPEELRLTPEQKARFRSGSAGNSPRRASVPSRRKPTARLTATPSFRRPSASTGPSPTSSA